MSLSVENVYQSESSVRKELGELRHDQLPIFISALLLLTWAWLMVVTLGGKTPGIEDLPLAVAFFAGCAALFLREDSYTLASWVVLLGLMTLDSLVVLTYPRAVSLSLGVVVVVVGTVLLGTWQGFVAGTAMWAIGATAWYVAAGLDALHQDMVPVLFLYYLVGSAVWVAARPQSLSVQWALTGWEHARQALREVQERRGELYRVVRALEEATRRIERVNNELLIAQREAEEARALQARLAATVSHELRGPLNLILGFSRLMALSPESYREPLPPSYRADVQTIYRNCQHLVSLVDDILDLSQIEAQHLPLVKDHVDLNQDVVLKTVEIVQPLAERKGLVLSLGLACGLPQLLADQVRLRQALLNLLINAVRLTDRGGIAVRTAQEGDSLVVSVQDTGPGIAAGDIPKLFKEFTMLQRTGAKEEGSGLGLSISKHLVELHGGQIWVQSRKGMGTTFFFSVPLPGAGSTYATPVRTQDAQKQRDREPRCLVVHQDPGIVRVLSRHIEGYRVVGLSDTERVMDMIEELRPRAVITTDELLPALTDRLQQASYDVPLITFGAPIRRDRIGRANLLGHLVKPISPDTLGAMIRQVERDGETVILLVDDDPDVVRLLEKMLMIMPRPYKILKAYDGRGALEVMSECVPDVVFIDLVMPEMDGQQTIVRMGEQERLRDVPVVLISAQDQVTSRMALQTPIAVRCRSHVEISRAANCFRGFMDALSPQYLEEPKQPERPAADPAV